MVACSDASSATQPATPTASAAQLEVAVEVSGAVIGTAGWTQSADTPTCSSFAAGINSDHTFRIPSGTSTASIAGNPFALVATVAGYHGPGRYGAAAFGDPTSTTLTVDVSSAQVPFEPVGPGSDETATVDADGSGSFAFDRWVDPGLRSESGTVTWTCR